MNPPPRVLRFGDFEVDLGAQRFSKRGVRIRLQQKPFLILAALLERPGQVITRNELRDRLWPTGVYVDFEHNLNRSMYRLRQVLFDTAQKPRFIETVDGVGYRFIAPVEDVNTPKLPAARLIVLPFENVTGFPEYETLADTLTEETIACLGRLLRDCARIIAIASAMRYRNTEMSIAQIARDLRAQYVLSARLQAGSAGIRIVVELIDPRDETSLWASEYHLPEAAPDKILKKLAASIAGTLRSELRPIGQVASRGRSVSLEVRQMYLSGRAWWNQRTEPAVRKAIALFEAAIQRDPKYALAQVAIAECHIVLTSWGVVSPLEAIRRAQEAAERALAVNREMAEPHVALAWAHVVLHRDWKAAEKEFQAAIRANPSYPYAYHWLGYFSMAFGRAADQAIAAIDSALDLDPLSVPIQCVRAWLLYVAGRYREAVRQCESALQLDPNHPGPYAYLAMACDQLGDYARAESAMEESAENATGMSIIEMLLAYAYARNRKTAKARSIAESIELRSKSEYLCAYYMAVMYTALGDEARAVSWLAQSRRDQDPWNLYFELDPRFRELRARREGSYPRELDATAEGAPEAISDGTVV